MTRKQSLWLFIWIFIFFLFFCIWHKLPHFSEKFSHNTPQEIALKVDNPHKKDIYIKLLKQEDSVTISGIVSSEDAKAKILDAYGKYFTDVDAKDLQIDTHADNAPLVSFLTNFADIFSTFQTGYLTYEHKQLEIDGIAPHNITAQRVQEELNTLHHIDIHNKLTCTEESNRQDIQVDQNDTTIKEPIPKPTLTQLQNKLNDLLKGKSVHFLYARDILTKSSQNVVETIITFLKAYPHLTLEIAGHTDSDGTRKNNLTLSQRRAESIKRYMIAKGIDKSRLFAKGYGESKPLVKNDSLKNKQINRRVEFNLKGEL